MMAVMDLSGISVRDAKDRIGSLSLALESLLRWAGANTSYRSLNASLALPLRTTAVRRSACLGWWSTHGSDAFLGETAQMFGLRIRALHPPDAAVGLSGHQPFEQHFEASYAPLVRRALEHDQPVIAWQGWPDARAWLWGVITGVCKEGLGFCGTVMWSHGKVVPIVKPPIQLYVVEEVVPSEPGEEEMLGAAAVRFQKVAHNAVEHDPDVVTGVEACDAWLERLRSEEVCPTCGVRGGRCHVQHARFISADRGSGARFFGHYRDGAGGAIRGVIEALVAECQGSIDSLATSRDPGAVDVLIRTAEGREALAAGVRAARTFDQATAAAVDRLAAALA